MVTEKRRAYLRNYQRQWMAKRRNDWLADKCCVKCGSLENLEVDHIDRTAKKYPVASLWGMSLDNLNRIAELAKCQVLCHSCHIEKTWSKDFQRAKCGTPSGYKKCKCDACREAATIDRRKYARNTNRKKHI